LKHLPKDLNKTKNRFHQAILSYFLLKKYLLVSMLDYVFHGCMGGHAMYVFQTNQIEATIWTTNPIAARNNTCSCHLNLFQQDGRESSVLLHCFTQDCDNCNWNYDAMYIYIFLEEIFLDLHCENMNRNYSNSKAAKHHLEMNQPAFLHGEVTLLTI